MAKGHPSESLFIAAYVMRSKAVIVEVLKRPLSNKRQMPKCIQKKQVLPIEKSHDEVVIVKCASIAPNASINSRALRGESQRSNLTISLTHSFSPRHSSVQCSSELLNSPLSCLKWRPSIDRSDLFATLFLQPHNLNLSLIKWCNIFSIIGMAERI
jgi:hypothetical protein